MKLPYNPFDRLSELAALQIAIYTEVARQHHLTLNELHFLYFIGRYGAVSPSKIGDTWSLPKQTVTSVCKQLAKKNLLTFLVDEKDKRSKLIHLSPQGKDFIKPIIDKMTEAELSVSQYFGFARFETLLNDTETILDKLATHLNTSKTE
ncbi:MarR family transcriptional regulator [Pelistega sp. NLN82]|uniref:MarR family transcriptional regulator n=1 Tax=Pelistega ratti TaxID=2652177 RepID=A0A6L9Y6P1_9BURK|nr:MarR family transcriptional regulator [Pelistega ratti]NEN75865.1 MarR family transcriptional regulator [Pelistega ratti]